MVNFCSLANNFRETVKIKVMGDAGPYNTHTHTHIWREREREREREGGRERESTGLCTSNHQILPTASKMRDWAI